MLRLRTSAKRAADPGRAVAKLQASVLFLALVLIVALSGPAPSSSPAKPAQTAAAEVEKDRGFWGGLWHDHRDKLGAAALAYLTGGAL